MLGALFGPALKLENWSEVTSKVVSLTKKWTERNIYSKFRKT